MYVKQENMTGIWGDRATYPQGWLCFHSVQDRGNPVICSDIIQNRHIKKNAYIR